MALSVSACGDEIGAAALVGKTAISTATVDATAASIGDLDSTLVTELGELSARINNSRSVLTHDIWHELLVQAGLFSPLPQSAVDQLVAGYAAYGSLGASLAATPENVGDRIGDATVLQNALSAAVTAGTPVIGPTVTLDVVLVPDLATAAAKRTEFLADPAAMDAELEPNATGFPLTFLEAPDLAGIGLFSTPPGEILIVPSQDGAVVLRVVSIQTGPLVLDPAALSQLTPSQANAIGALILAQQLLQPVVKVNPKYGVWDPALLQVVATPGFL